MRKKIYEMVDAVDSPGIIDNIYDYIMLIVITGSLIPLAFKNEHPVLIVLDKICVVVFIIDYLLRWITADYKYGKKSVISFICYPISPMAIIDLLSILPSLTIVNSGLKLFRIFRLARSLRVFRVFKTLQYSKSMLIIIKVLKNSRESLIAVSTLAFAYILISALLVYNVEPESFNSFFEAVYWAAVSLTTIGYGDIYPVTSLGRTVTILSSILGIAIVALPSSILTAGYMKEISSHDKEKKNKN